MSWISRLTNVFRADRLSHDLDRELEFHIAERTETFIGQGMSPALAAREARRLFGNRTAVKEKAHDMDVLAWLESLGADIRYALRGLRATPGFTAVAVLSLALGIGANTAIFSLANALVFKSLPVRDPEQLVAVEMTPDGGDTFTNPLWEQIRDRANLFDGTFAYGTDRFNLVDGGEERRVPGAWVSGDFFRVLGVRTVAGRPFTKADDVRGCAPTAVVSAGFADRAYGGADSAVGKSISLNGHPFPIVGAIDPDFFGIEVGRTVDVYAPLCTQTLLYGAEVLDHRSRWYLNVAGRRLAGMPDAQLKAKLEAEAPAIFAATLPARYGASDAKEYLAQKLGFKQAASGFSDARDRYRGALFTLMAVVGVVLLIACANIANLLLARAAAREREIAIRLAIGAGRGRVIRQLLTESLVLALLGAGLGMVFARWASGLLVQFISSSRRPLWLDLSLDPRVLLFAIGAAALTAVLFGLVPAWRATRVDPQAALKAGGRGLVRGDKRRRLGKALVVAQVSLSLALVAAAGLLVNSFRRLNAFDPGFRRDGVLVVSMEFENGGYKKEEFAQAQAEVLRRARAVPGIISATTALLTPIGSMSWNDFIAVPGVAQRTRKDSLVFFNEIRDGYFATLGTPVVAGRDLAADDELLHRRVAVVNETLAKRWFAGQNALGRTFQTAGPGDTLSAPVEIVGVVRDAKYQRIDETTYATAYVPPGLNEPPGSYVQLVLRTAGPPASVAPSIRALAADVNPRISLDFMTLEAQVDASLARPRLLATLSGFMGALALVLAVIGLYGMMSYDVTRRRNEIGIRKALGAPTPQLWRMVAGEASQLIGAGVVIGALIALASTRLMSAFLFGLTATDPGTFIFAAVLLAASGMLAASLPAWRAARLDPMEALREE